MEVHWSPPAKCYMCHHPVGMEGRQCLHCGAPRSLWSSTGAAWIGERARRGLLSLLDLGVWVLFTGAGLYLCYKISPLILFFPLLCVAFQRE